MINLIFRGGAGGHTVSALLDYCTQEGNLPGYPDMISGDNLHSQRLAHEAIKNTFYKDYLHDVDDAIMYEKLDDGNYKIQPQLLEYDIGNAPSLAPIATDDFGRMLIFAMSLGKCYNKQMPPHDEMIDYSACATMADRLEKVTLILSNQLTMSFEEFHNHPDPTHSLDINWLWTNPDAIAQVIVDCGWTPKTDKIRHFCTLTQEFNQKYFSMISESFAVFQDAVDSRDRPCELTFYQCAVVHALLMKHFGCTGPEDIRLVHRIPTSTVEFLKYIV